MKLLPNFVLNCGFISLIFIVTSCSTLDKSVETMESKLLKSQQNCQRSEQTPNTLRMGSYRAPTPECIPWAITLNTAELVQLINNEPELILIDVLSILSRPNTEFGEAKWIPNSVRMSLPESVWLPNVGYGSLDEEMQFYFTSQLHKLTQGNKSTALIFFCIADCWMSWNAIKRADAYGYTNLYWYRNGTDGWAEAGLELIRIEPVPLAKKD